MPEITFSYTVAPASVIAAHPAYQLAGGDPALDAIRGFGIGAHYMLPTKADGRIDVRPGQTTRVFYFGDPTGPNAADVWTQAEIAAAEGQTFVDADACALWILNQPAVGQRYGELRTKALDHALSAAVQRAYFFLGPGRSGNSPWFLYEPGCPVSGMYTGSGSARDGESPLHPILYGTWDRTTPDTRPVLDWPLNVAAAGLGNWVFDGIQLVNSTELKGNIEHLMWHNCRLGGVDSHISGTGTQPSTKDDPAFGVAHRAWTLWDCQVFDAQRAEPLRGGTHWSLGRDDRFEGFYTANTIGLLVKETVFDHNGWGDGYRFDRRATGPQVPTMFSHNIYTGQSIEDRTDWGNFYLRGASSGTQVRSGSFFCLDIFGENNNAHQAAGPDSAKKPIWGNYTTILYEIVQGAGCKTTDQGADEGRYVFVDGNPAGAVTGFTKWDKTYGVYSAVVWELIEHHMINPAKPDERSPVNILKSTFSPTAWDVEGTLPRLHELKHVRYKFGTDYNVEGLSTSAMNTATLQRWTDAQKGEPAGTNNADGMADVGAYLRTLDTYAGVAVSAWNYVAPAYGYTTFTRSVPTTLVFTPWPKADGFRWDNPKNWSTGDWPGFVPGDSVDIDGHIVYAYDNVDLVNVDLGAGGYLMRTGGQLTISGALRGSGNIHLGEAAQLRLSGAVEAGPKTLTTDEGALIFDADTTGELWVVAEGAKSEVVVTEGVDVSLSSLEISDPSCRVGFDGETGGASSLSVATALTFTASSGEIGQITEVYSGVYGFDANGRIKTPDVASTLVLEAGCVVTVETTGLAAGTTHTLIDVDTLTNNGAILPAGVSVTGGRLQVTV